MVWFAAVSRPDFMYSLKPKQIQCGNVIVSPEEKVSDVKASIVSSNISKDKRKKSSKYALAVASSFGHVHAFLQDEDCVLDKIDSTTAEEKCLMLIKKPKSSSKKMFKSQSWANLSLSDSHLYNQPNYNTEGRRHKYRMKRKPSDLQTVPSDSMMNLTGYGMPVDSYIPQQRDVKNRDPRNIVNRFSGVASPQSCHSEDLTYRNGNMNGNLTEINNNKLAKQSGNRMYSSHMDIYRAPPKLSHIKENVENCVIRSDEMYSDKLAKNESHDQDSVSRAHSVGDLSTGLTLSVVGQRKADSVQCLSNSQTSTFKPLSEDSAQLKKVSGKMFSQTEAKRKETARKCAENKKDLQNTLRDLLTNINETKDKEMAKNQHSTVEKRDSNTPVKPKRALPSVPQGQANDRKKHYTEMVKMRMSQHSRSGLSSSSGTSSSVRTVQDTPLDKEVSDLLDNDRESCPGMLENVKYSENNGNNSHRKHANHDTLNVSIPSSVRSCDSGQATITSLSSTVDSGYLTNDAENDMYSSVSYTKSLQRSAQNFYSKKNPVTHSQSLHQESASARNVKKILPKESAIVKDLSKSGHFSNDPVDREEIVGIRTFPRSSQRSERSDHLTEQYVTSTMPEDTTSNKIQETLKSNPKVCDKLVKYSSMKQLPTFECSGQVQGQMVQTLNNIVKSDNDLEKALTNNENCNTLKAACNKNLNHETTLTKCEVKGPVSMPESHYNTLPGNWKFQSTQNKEDNSASRIPSLHQLSHTYKFFPVTLSVGLEYNILDHIHLCENCIMLQNSRKNQKRESTAMSPPQGKYARLGGPGSAFKPVKVSDTSLYSVISIQELSSVFQNKSLHKGDIIVEVNNTIILGETLNSVQGLISNSSSEVYLTIARTVGQNTSCTQTTNQNNGQEINLSNENSGNNNQPPKQTEGPKTSNLMDSQVEHLKKQIAKLNNELKRKNKAIRELNSLLPWQPDQKEINGNNEITLNGLSEDEFIV